MSNALRPFKIVANEVEEIVMADSVTTAEKYAQEQATSDIEIAVTPLTEADYRTTDFSEIQRVEGGKADAPVSPFFVKVGDKESVILAVSAYSANKFATSEIKDEAGFTVEPLPVAEYPTTDWTKVKELEVPAKSKRGRKPKTESTEPAAVDMGGIPGME